jgi:hypothetical protein
MYLGKWPSKGYEQIKDRAKTILPYFGLSWSAVIESVAAYSEFALDELARCGGLSFEVVRTRTGDFREPSGGNVNRSSIECLELGESRTLKFG